MRRVAGSSLLNVGSHGSWNELFVNKDLAIRFLVRLDTFLWRFVGVYRQWFGDFRGGRFMSCFVGFFERLERFFLRLGDGGRIHLQSWSKVWRRFVCQWTELDTG